MSFPEMRMTKRRVGWKGESGGAENGSSEEFYFGFNRLRSLLGLQVERSVNSDLREVRDRDLNLGTYRLNFYIDTLL